MNNRGQRRSAAPWTVALLCLMYGFSIVDRLMPTLLVEDLARDLAVSNVQFGLLFGTSFGLVYAAAGLPLARWIDRGDRRRILFGAILLWSLCTIAAGAAQSYGQLLAMRIGLAAGEAALIPVAMSMIADLYPPERRTVPVTVFVGCGVAMGGASFLLCGGALAAAQALAPLMDVAQWRLSFVIVGIPPLLLALLWAATVREPERRPDDMPQSADAGVMFAHLAAHPRLYVPLLLTVGVVSSLAVAILAWVPTILVQEHGLSATEAATAMVATSMPSALLAWPLAPYLAIAAERRRFPGGAITVMMALLVIGIGGATVLALADTLPTALAAVAGLSFGLPGLVILNMLFVQWVAPNQFRARLTAVGQLASSLGYAVGPPLVAVLESAFLPTRGHLSSALAFMFLVGGGLTVGSIFALKTATLSMRKKVGGSAA